MATTKTPNNRARTTTRGGTGKAAPSAADPDLSPILAPLEAIFVSADRALSSARIATALALEDGSGDVIARAIDALNEQYASTGRAFRIEKVAGAWRLMTLPEHAPCLARLHGLRESHRLSRAAVETLAIVAYRQPITRAEIEAIRGVACGDILRALIDRHLVTISGRAEELGRPMLYATTRHFLETFGLASIKDLPDVADVLEVPRAAPAPEDDAPESQGDGEAPESESDA